VTSAYATGMQSRVDTRIRFDLERMSISQAKMDAIIL
jgi:hypothetical protein